MDNYRSEWILAKLKRKLIEISRRTDKEVVWYSHEAAKGVLTMISEIEADAVLGTPELIDEEVNKLMPGGDAECADCRIDIGEVDI